MKQSITKETTTAINDLRRKSLSEREILEKLSEVYANKAGLVRLMITTPTEYKRRKYKRTLLLLACLYGLNFFLDVYLFGFVLDIDQGVAAFYVFRALISFVGNLVLPIFILKFKPFFYILVPLFSIHAILQLYIDVDQWANYPQAYLMVKIALTLLLLVFSVVMLRKVFPNFLKKLGAVDLAQIELDEP